MNKISFNNVISAAGLILAAFVLFTVFSNPPMVQKAYGQVGTINTAPVFQVNAADACLNPTIAKTEAVVNISSATTVTLVPAVTGKAQYLCGLRVSAGAAQTITLVTGSGTNCATSPVTNSGAIAFTGATNGPVDIVPNGMSSMISPKGGEVCATTTTTGSLQGIVVIATQ